MSQNTQTNQEIDDMSKIKNTKSCFKADIIIKMNKTKTIYKASIKSKNGASPSILNHTSRKAKVFNISGVLYKYLPILDEIMNEYIDKRNKKIITEDICLTDLDCFKNFDIYNGFIDVLIYFVFHGTGKGYSKIRSDSILYYKDDKIWCKYYRCWR